mmetsp:Transcript_56131/g.99950  ORF Transcript_56131/g.99950 Transcript_56131/m.99950 type:complete len:318 (-) Transcript_56131:102-1055(-)
MASFSSSSNSAAYAEEVLERNPSFVARAILAGVKKAKPHVISFLGFDTEKRELTTHEMIAELVKRDKSNSQTFDLADAEKHTSPAQAVNSALNELPIGKEHTNMTKRLQRELVTRDRKDPLSSIAVARIIAVDPRHVSPPSDAHLQQMFVDDDDNRSVHSKTSRQTGRSRTSISSSRRESDMQKAFQDQAFKARQNFRPPPLKIAETNEEDLKTPVRSARSLRSANLAQLRAELQAEEVQEARRLSLLGRQSISRQSISRGSVTEAAGHLPPPEPTPPVSPIPVSSSASPISPKWNQPIRGHLKRSATAPKLLALAT